MDTQPLKIYASEARKKFIEAVRRKAATFGLTKTKISSVREKDGVAVIDGLTFPESVARRRDRLADRIRRQGFDAFVESIAYFWFNRFVTIRFMEVNGYLSHGYRVLGASSVGNPVPEILENALRVELPGLDRDKVPELLRDGNKDEELYRLLLVGQCNALHRDMPFLFEAIGEDTELLLPDNLLHGDSLIRTLVDGIPEELWTRVEAIGWLYQFYISERKERVLGRVVASEDIPAATQLFTPNWIAKYLVQNTLGRQWTAVYPDSPLKNDMEFFIETGKQEPEVVERLKAITPEEPDPEELTFLDPACGSGHILVEAYDLFKRIYRERGCRDRDIPALILNKNIFGLEIDERAAQLAAFALLTKAREDDPQLFEREDRPHPNIVCFVDSGDLDAESIAAKINVPEKDVAELLGLFKHAKTFGSLIRIPENVAAILPVLRERTASARGDSIEDETAGRFLSIVRQAEFLVRRYDCVVANPPYLGGKAMNRQLKEFGERNYPDSKNDLFAMFIERNGELAGMNGDLGFMSPFVWMFISSYEKLRKKMIDGKTLTTLIQLEYSGFGDATVPICTLTCVNRRCPGYRGAFIRLSDFRGPENQRPKTLEAIRNPDCGWFYRTCAEEFEKIPGRPMAYWLGEREISAFTRGTLLESIASPKQGLATTDNDRFLRLWFELPRDAVGFGFVDGKTAARSGVKWFPYNKGGNYRRWYGNNEYVVNWQDDGREIKETVCRKYPYLNGNPDYVTKNRDCYFREGITWTYISSAYFGVRYSPPGFVFDVAGSSVFPSAQDVDPLLGFMCSKVADLYISAINPTLNIQAGNVGKLPVLPIAADRRNEHLAAVVRGIVEIAKRDWDAYETSWDFSTSPLLDKYFPGETLEKTYRKLREQWRDRTREMQRLEEENNRVFIDAYGLRDELSPTVDLKEITLTCNPKYRYGDDIVDEELETRLRSDTVKEFLSYAVGCAMGRYSLDEPGLVYARSGNIGFDMKRYKAYPADEDGIVPLLERDWFPGDMARRFVDFLEVVFGRDESADDLKFVEDTLGKSVRDYFAGNFFADHIKRYKKRPVYWLFSSGKQRAFQCLVYLHRYNSETLARMRAKYLVPLKERIAERIKRIGVERKGDLSTATAGRLDKERDRLVRQAGELQVYDEKLRHYADRRIELDLDDGVKANYAKFGDLLAGF